MQSHHTNLGFSKSSRRLYILNISKIMHLCTLKLEEILKFINAVIHICTETCNQKINYQCPKDLSLAQAMTQKLSQKKECI